MTLKIECEACNATGLYQGFAERKGEAVICLRCGGTGCDEITVTKFTKRKQRRGIKRITWSRGLFLMSGCGSAGEAITYKEFVAGKLPPTKEVDND